MGGKASEFGYLLSSRSTGGVRNRDWLWEDVASAASLLSFLKNLLFNLDGITEVDTMGEANIIGAGRIEAVIHPVEAKVTLLSRFLPAGSDQAMLFKRYHPQKPTYEALNCHFNGQK